jgi:Homing endonuclease associated repeat/HNH endonuclease
MVVPAKEKQFLDELKRVWMLLGRRPTYGEFKVHGKIGVKTYERTYGSWTKAVAVLSKQAGIVIQGTKSTNVNLEVLRSELLEISKKNRGMILQHKDYKKLGGTYSIGTFQQHFGSWKKAVRAIGLKDGHSRARPDLRHYSDDDYFAEMRRLWQELGRQPTSLEMRSFGKISPQAFYVRFGGWPLAVEAYKKRRNAIYNRVRLAEEVSESSGYREGSVKRILVNRYERDPGARQRCIEHFGTACNVCEFDFVAVYGKVMAGFIHVHHVKALSALGANYEVDPIRDLRPVCPNCHSVLHYREPPYSIDEVKQLLQDHDRTRGSQRNPYCAACVAVGKIEE